MKVKQNKEKIFIYGLCDVKDPDNIKYVGKTKQKITKRIHDHIRESYKLKTKKDKWIQNVLVNSEIIYKIIEEVDENNWLEREMYWIKILDNLTNTSKGGDGGRGLIYTKSYEELKEFINENGSNIKNSSQWLDYVNNNPQYKFLPKHPQVSYKKRGWAGWDDFLISYDGIEGRRNAFRTFFDYDTCKNHIKKYGIKNSRDWRDYVKDFDSRVPTSPPNYYSKTNEWEGWGEFLGTKKIHNKNKFFLSYNEAKKIIKQFDFNKRINYVKYVEDNGLIDEIPRHPNRYYSKTNEWEGWGER